MRALNRLGRAVLLAATVAVVAAWGNGDRPAALVGDWIASEPAGGRNLSLRNDGTGLFGTGDITSWKVAGGRLIIFKGEQGDIFDYSVSGDNLTVISIQDKSRAVFITRKGAAEKRNEAQRKQMVEIPPNNCTGPKTCKQVKIGAQTWMAENLNIKTGKSWCYKDDESKCKEFGRLYDWETAKKVCPSGWHLPTRAEWKNLVGYAGGEDVASNKLKAKSGWNDLDNGASGNGADDFGFAALPGGNFSGDDFSLAGKYGFWWTATRGAPGNAFFGGMHYYDGHASEDSNDRGAGRSVRCVGN
jgi:uncharacterized protein (TIGR02145 family)